MAETEVPERILAEIAPSSARRVIAVTMAFGLGLVMVYVTFATPPQSILWRATFLVAGIGSLLIGDLVRRATAFRIIMTHDVIRDTTGRVLCQLDDIVGMERGALAFKPSNGFLLVTKVSQPKAWAPGLWWRFGRRIGVGGVTSAAQAKLMADLVLLKLNGDLERFQPRDSGDVS